MTADEVEYLRTKQVLVTTSRVEIKGQIFALRNIGSIKVTQPRFPLLAVFFAVVSLTFLVGGKDRASNAIFGLLLLSGCAAWIWQQTRMRRLVIATTGGEVVALASTDRAEIERVRDAIQQAISTR